MKFIVVGFILVFLFNKRSYGLCALIFGLSLNISSGVASQPEIQARVDYSHVFTREIYQQNLALSEGEVKADKSAQLPERRKAQIEAQCLQQLQAKKKQHLNKLFQQAESLISVYEQQRNNVVTFHRINSVFQGLAAILGAEKSETTGWKALAVGGQTVNAVVNDPPSISDINIRIEMLRQKMQQWEEGLDQGPIEDYEARYVKIKRLLHSDLQAEIEEELLNAYNSKDAFFSLITKQFMDFAIALPYRPTPVFQGNSQEEDLELSKRFMKHPIFKFYPQENREQLLGIARKIAFAASDHDNTTALLKKLCYIQGNPGCGKSLSCKELAKFLNVPYFEISIRTAADLAMGKVEGGNRYNPQANIGWIVEALLGDRKEGQSFDNGILVLNDFDRVLDSPQALSFLLDYLDPDKGEIYLPFFNIKHGIRRLSILLTANQVIPESKIYEALKSRIPVIRLPDFSASAQIEILNQGYLKDLLRHFSFPNWIESEYPNDANFGFKSSLNDELIWRCDLSGMMAGKDLRARKILLDEAFAQASLKMRQVAELVYQVAEELLENPRTQQLRRSFAVLKKQYQIWERASGIGQNDARRKARIVGNIIKFAEEDQELAPTCYALATHIFFHVQDSKLLRELDDGVKQAKDIQTYVNDLNVEQDVAIAGMKIAHQFGWMKAAYRLGEICLEGGETDEAQLWFLKVAEHRGKPGFQMVVTAAERKLDEIEKTRVQQQLQQKCEDGEIEDHKVQLEKTVLDNEILLDIAQLGWKDVQAKRVKLKSGETFEKAWTMFMDLQTCQPEFLDLSGCDLQSKIEDLAQWVSQNPKLVKLELPTDGLLPESLFFLTLAEHNGLRDLRLSQFSGSQKTYGSRGKKIIQKLKGLGRLELNGFPSSSFGSLEQTLKQNAQTLKHLDLSGTNLGSGGAAILECLERLVNLESLNILDASLSNGSTVKIAKSLETKGHLSSVKLAMPYWLSAGFEFLKRELFDDTYMKVEDIKSGVAAVMCTGFTPIILFCTTFDDIQGAIGSDYRKVLDSLAQIPKLSNLVLKLHGLRQYPQWTEQKILALRTEKKLGRVTSEFVS